MNYLKTAVLMAIMTAIFMTVGFLLGGQGGLVVAFVVALAMNMFSYWNSDKMVLKMHGAVEVDRSSAPEYFSIVEQLVENADLPMPKVYVMHNPQPNAFATGRNPENAAVAATTGLLDMLSKEELAGVMAHELAHIKNRDTLIMTITATIAGAIGMLVNFAQFGMMFGGGRSNNNPLGWIGTLAVLILAPMAAMIVQMAISRSREYQADKLGAQICQRPMWLASALNKISSLSQGVPLESAERNPATAHLFIINPLTGRGMDSLFSTHPNTDNRINALQSLANDWGTPGAVRTTSVPSTEESRYYSDDRQKGPWS